MRNQIAMLASAFAVLTLLNGCASVRVPADDLVTARVRSALARAVPQTAVEMNVSTNEGLVAVAGPIVSTDAAHRAVEAATRVDGVRAVQYDLWLVGAR